MKTTRNVFGWLALTTGATFLTGCLAGSNGGNGGHTVEILNDDEVEPIYSQFDVNAYKLNQVVCDPFEGDQSPAVDAGLKAELYYLPAGSGSYSSVAEYIQNGLLSDKTIFFSQMNVPTRKFDLGFPTETGEMVKNDAGEDLHEHFALKMNTIIKLGAEEEEGLYEFALLSDDGSTLEIRDTNGEYQMIVNNDGNHPTKMGCSTQSFYMTHETELVAKLNYYQGPRYHISLIPLKRKLAEGESAGKDASCGLSGNSKFFDYNNNSKPQATYLAMLDRGWLPLSANNYSIPNTAQYNPCVSGEVPIITSLSLSEDKDRPGVIRVDWKTDIPATTQVRIVNLDTGKEVVTDSDNILRVFHTTFISSLQKNVNYLIQAVAISDTLGKSLSEGVSVYLD